MTGVIALLVGREALLSVKTEDMVNGEALEAAQPRNNPKGSREHPVREIAQNQSTKYVFIDELFADNRQRAERHAHE